MKRIPCAEPALGHKERRSINRVLRTKWLTSGAVCARFEEEFKRACRARHAITVSSATAGLHLALAAEGFDKESILLVSPYTFVASAAVARHLGMRVRFVDIEAEGYNIDCNLLEQTVCEIRQRDEDQRRIAIMAVHIGGRMCDMKRISAIAAAYNCYVVEDAAHCQPLIGEGGRVAARGDCVIFSFYATKPITSGEGGMIITEDDARAKRMRLLRNHGMDSSVWERTDGKGRFWAYDITAHGYKYNLPDLLAAIGRVQLHKARANWSARCRIAEYYYHRLRAIPAIEPPQMEEGQRLSSPLHAWHLFMCQITPRALTITRDQLMAALKRAGVECSLHYIPLHMTRVYREEYGYREEDFPRAAARYRSVLSLPLYPHLTQRQCARVVMAIERITAAHTCSAHQ